MEYYKKINNNTGEWAEAMEEVYPVGVSKARLQKILEDRESVIEAQAQTIAELQTTIRYMAKVHVRKMAALRQTIRNLKRDMWINPEKWEVKYTSAGQKTLEKVS